MPRGAQTDAELARKITSAHPGDARAAEAELCRRFGRRLLAFAWRRLGAREEARDLAQETLLLTLEKLRAGEVRRPEKISAFILGVARTLATSWRARDGRARAVSLDRFDSDVVALAANGVETPDPDPIVRQRLTGCLDSLSERHRAIVLLTFYADQTSTQIASSLGLSRSNVRVLRHRGVRQLRSCLGVEAGIEGSSA